MNAQPLAALPEFALPRPDRRIGTAIAASVAIHALVLAWQHGALPAFEDAPRAPLNVVLRTTPPQPKPAGQPEPVAAIAPRVTEPAPPHPPKAAQPAPRPAPVLTRAATPDAPAPRVEAHPAPAPVAAPAPVQVDTTPPRPAAPVPVAVARAEPAAPAAAEDAIDPNALDRYGRSLSSLFARQQNYPRLAAMRGWEGEVQVRITIARKGNVVATQVVRSSGFEVLDQSAVQLVAGAGTLPRPPENLQNREFQVIVPVHYRLEKSS